MTDPVVLYGTQSNGETLPVQVDDTGRLVAEGLQGQEGPPGPPGQPGADGGAFPLPPDPYEGALLGWLNGGLAWVGTTPIPIPEEVFGPITAYDPQTGVVTVQGEIPADVGNGVYLTQTDQYGRPVNDNHDWLVSMEWSNRVVAFDQYGNYTASSTFDANDETFALSTENYSLQNLEIPFVETLAVYLYSGGGDVWTMYAGFNGGNRTPVTGSGNYMLEHPIILSVNGELNSIELDINGYYHGGFWKIIADGKLLVDESIGAVVGRVNQKINEHQLLIVKSQTDDFTVGNYLMAPKQEVAPWVLYEGDPTSRIDYLRQIRD